MTPTNTAKTKISNQRRPENSLLRSKTASKSTNIPNIHRRRDNEDLSASLFSMLFLNPAPYNSNIPCRPPTPTTVLPNPPHVRDFPSHDHRLHPTLLIPRTRPLQNNHRPSPRCTGTNTHGSLSS